MIILWSIESVIYKNKKGNMHEWTNPLKTDLRVKSKNRLKIISLILETLRDSTDSDPKYMWLFFMMHLVIYFYFYSKNWECPYLSAYERAN